MTVLQGFVRRVRRAPAWQRDGALIAASLVVAVLAGTLVPADGDEVDIVLGNSPGAAPVAQGQTGPRGDDGGPASAAGPVTAVDGPSAAGSGGTEAVMGVASSSAGGGRTTGAAAGGAGAGGGGCVSPPGTDVGVTDGQIKIAVILLEVVGPAGNATFGLPSPDTQKVYYQTVIDSLNASGGVACRKLVPTYYTANPADQSQLQQTCQDIVAAKPFFAIDFAGYGVFPAIASCFPTNRVPLLLGSMPAKMQQQFYPYLFTQRLTEVVLKNAVFALEQRGFFDPAKGFRKLGFVYRDCVREYHTEFIEWLHQAGLTDSQIVSFNIGCPAGIAPPSTFSQAVLTFRQQGVTHASVVDDGATDFYSLTTIAQQQGFRPVWGLPDIVIVNETYGTQHPDYDNIANAVAITGSSTGQAKTPGDPVSAGTAGCNAIFTAAGQPPVYQQQAGAGGIACSQLWMLKAMVEHAPSLARASLAEGLHAAGSFDVSYPWGPNDFSPNTFTGPRVTYGEQFWRAVQFKRSCDCWQVVDREWHPSFQ